MTTDQLGQLRRETESLTRRTIDIQARAAMAYSHHLDDEEKSTLSNLRVLAGKANALKPVIDRLIQLTQELAPQAPAEKQDPEPAELPDDDHQEEVSNEPTPLDRARQYVRVVGEVTNARLQKQLGISQPQAKDLIDTLVGERELFKHSPKLYATQPVSEGSP